MCRITGIHYFNEDKKVNPSLLNRITDTLSHRGPDGRGIYINPSGNLGFGHRRLSIIDLSESARQPISNEV